MVASRQRQEQRHLIRLTDQEGNDREVSELMEVEARRTSRVLPVVW